MNPKAALVLQCCIVAPRNCLVTQNRFLADRATRLLYLTVGWVGQQALLVSEDKAVQQEAARRLLRQHAAYEATKAQGAKFWNKMVARSIFGLVATEQLVLLLQASGGQVDDKLKTVIMQRLAGIGQSKVSEDAMNIGRSLESSARNKGQAPIRRLWMELVDKGLASRLYQYAEPPWRNLLAPVGAQSQLPESLFKPKMKSTPRWVRDIVSARQQPSWFSSTPAGGNVVYADLLLMGHAHETQRWDQIARGAYLSQLCRDAPLGIRAVGGSRWFICLADVVGEAVVAWLAVAVMEGEKVQSLSLDPHGSPELLLVYDHLQWDAVAYQWISPWGQVSRGAIRPLDASSQPAVVAWVDSAPRDLLEVAAANAFWNVTEVGLGWYCRYLGIKKDKGLGLVGTLELLMSTLLPHLTPQQIVDLMQPRARMPPFYDEVLMAEDADDLIDEKDQADFRNMKAYQMGRCHWRAHLMGGMRPGATRTGAATRFGCSAFGFGVCGLGSAWGPCSETKTHAYT